MRFVRSTSTILSLLATLAASAQASRVVVGGIYLDSDLIDASNSVEFRSYPNTGLYIHNGGNVSGVNYGWLSLTATQKESMISVWGSTGAQSLELGWEADGVGWQNAYTQNYLPEGVVADEVSANVPTGDANGYGSDTDAFAQIPASDISWWTVYVDGFRNLSNGAITNIYPVYAPNENNKDPQGNKVQAWLEGGTGPNPFATGSFFADVREMAMYGGGISVDSPPQQFFDNVGGSGSTTQAQYQAIAEGEVAWANANNLHSIWIISPSTSKSNYNAISQQLVRTLETNATGSQADIPSEYCVENYGVNSNITTYNPIGSEDSPNTELGVALWLAGYEQGRTGDLQMSTKATGTTQLNIQSQSATALAGTNTAISLSSAGSQALTYAVTLQNTSSNSSDWYIPNLLVTQSGAIGDWSIKVTLNGLNITSYLLGNNGFTFNATAIIANAGLVMNSDFSENLLFTFTPLTDTASTDPYSFELTGLAHPGAADSFASVVFEIPEPTALGISLIGLPCLLRRRIKPAK
ncbi:MAG TPA: hypothetical protein VGG19_11370 [Tepidisphaeraceae bacterium]|jgi:hypothetical protein